MQEMSRRNQHFTDSVIRRMTRVSLDCGAINLAQGFPDFDPPKAMTDRLREVEPGATTAGTRSRWARRISAARSAASAAGSWAFPSTRTRTSS